MSDSDRRLGPVRNGHDPVSFDAPPWRHLPVPEFRFPDRVALAPSMRVGRHARTHYVAVVRLGAVFTARIIRDNVDMSAAGARSPLVVWLPQSHHRAVPTAASL